MKNAWSKNWVSSVQPRKQRKYRANAPLHIKQSFLSSHLSPELRKTYGKRSIRVRTGDKVRVVRGQYKGQSGKVERVDVKNSKVFVTKIEQIRKDGTKSLVPLEPSNLMIIELNTEDKKRIKAKKEENKSG